MYRKGLKKNTRAYVSRVLRPGDSITVYRVALIRKISYAMARKLLESFVAEGWLTKVRCLNSDGNVAYQKIDNEKSEANKC